MKCNEEDDNTLWAMARELVENDHIAETRRSGLEPTQGSR